MRWAATAIAAGALALVPLAAFAQASAPACAASDAAPPTGFEAWAVRAPLVASAKAADLPKASLTVGKGFDAELPPAASVAYVTPPEKRGGPSENGGLFDLTVAEAGAYRIAIGSGAWIDVLQNGKPLQSTTHDHGPACSTLRKIVDFDLQPGHYVVQITANTDPTLPIMVVRRP